MLAGVALVKDIHWMRKTFFFFFICFATILITEEEPQRQREKGSIFSFFLKVAASGVTRYQARPVAGY